MTARKTVLELQMAVGLWLEKYATMGEELLAILEKSDKLNPGVSGEGDS